MGEIFAVKIKNKKKNINININKYKIKIEYFPITLSQYSHGNKWQTSVGVEDREQILSSPFFQNLPLTDWQVRSTENAISLSNKAKVILGTQKIPMISYVKIKEKNKKLKKEKK